MRKKTANRKINGLRFRFHLWGDRRKPVLFLIHGYMDMGASFDDLAQVLSKKYFCIAPDLRGFGATEHTPNPLGYFFYEYIPDLHEIFRIYSPNHPIRAIGHSMGANILSLYAGTFPERVSHFVNLEGFGIHDQDPSESPARLRKWTEGLKHPRSFWKYPSLTALSERIQRANPHFPKTRLGFLAQNLSRKVRGGYQISADPKHKWIHPYPFQLKNISEFWRRIAAQVLVLVAERRDPMKTVPNTLEAIRKRLSHYPAQTRTEVIPGVGHMLHIEAPERISLQILEFLDS